jgi:hypothetical protein
MKNLANCKPSEFLRQTNKIRKAVEKWLTVTEIMKIRSKVPELKKIDIDMTVEDKAEVQEENRKRMRKQAIDNAMEILDAVMDKHPDETLELLALLCFVEPEHVDDHEVGEYLDSFTELIGNDSVINFFTSLARLERMDSAKR